MTETDSLHAMTRHPENIAFYLLGSGWSLVGATNDESLWSRSAADGRDWQLVAPIGGESPAAVRQLNEALSVLSSFEHRRPESLIQDLGTSTFDVIRLRTYPKTRSGAAPLREVTNWVESTRELLVAAATTADDRREVLGSRKPGKAIEFADSLTVSTEAGSFVLALEAAVEPAYSLPQLLERLSVQDALFPDPAAPFERRATETLVSASRAAALAAVSETSHEQAFGAAVQQGVSANFLEALAALGGVPGDEEIDVKTGRFQPFELAVRWSFGRPTATPSGPVHFNAEFAPVFASAARAIRVRNPERDVEVSGRITALRDDEEGGGTVTVLAEVTDDDITRVRPVRVALVFEQYRAAIAAKARNQRVRVVGDLQRGHQLTVRPVRSFTAIEESASGILE